MEVRDQVIHGAKLIRRPDENTCLAATSADLAIRVDGTFERPHGRRTNSPHRAAGPPRGLDRCRGLVWNHVPLLVHDMFCGIIDLDGSESAGADMENDLGAPNATPHECCDKLWSE